MALQTVGERRVSVHAPDPSTQSTDPQARLAALGAIHAASIRIRFEELAKLTRLLEAEEARRETDRTENRRRLQDLKATMEKLWQRNGRSAAEDRKTLLAYARDLEGRHTALLGSFSWRAFEGVRWLSRRLRGRKPPKIFKPRLCGRGAKGQKMDLPMTLAYVRDLERRHVAVLESRSWRAMAPVRSLERLRRGKKPPKTFEPRLSKLQRACDEGEILAALYAFPDMR